MRIMITMMTINDSHDSHDDYSEGDEDVDGPKRGQAKKFRN